MVFVLAIWYVTCMETTPLQDEIDRILPALLAAIQKDPEAAAQILAWEISLNRICAERIPDNHATAARVACTNDLEDAILGR